MTVDELKWTQCHPPLLLSSLPPPCNQNLASPFSLWIVVLLKPVIHEFQRGTKC